MANLGEHPVLDNPAFPAARDKASFPEKVQSLLDGFDWRYQSLETLVQEYKELLRAENLSPEEYSHVLQYSLYNNQAVPFMSFLRMLAACLRKLVAQERLALDCPGARAQAVFSPVEWIQNFLQFNAHDVGQCMRDRIVHECEQFELALEQLPGVLLNFVLKDFRKRLEECDSQGGDCVDLSACCQEELCARFFSEYQKTSESGRLIKKLANKQIGELIAVLCQRFAAAYNASRDLVVKEIEFFKAHTDKMQIANKYLLIALLRELSATCYKRVLECAQKSFIAHLGKARLEEFAKFVIETHELLHLCESESVPEIQTEVTFEEQEGFLSPPPVRSLGDKKRDIFREARELEHPEDRKEGAEKGEQEEEEEKARDRTIEMRISEIEADRGKRMVKRLQRRGDGHEGFLVQKDNGESYVVHSNAYGRVVAVNIKHLQGNWCYTEGEMSDDEGEEVGDRQQHVAAGVYSSLDAQKMPNRLRGRPLTMEVGMANIGSSFGYCLANINNYSSKTEFLKDFGYSAAKQGSLLYIVQQVPVLSVLVLVGGLGWTTLKLYENKTANGLSKLKQVGKIAVNTGAGIGAGVTGAILGQMLIPVPVLGAFVGGMIGGIIGYKSSHSVIELLNKSRFLSLCRTLEARMHEEGYWEYSAENVSTLGIANAFFKSSLPERFHSQFASQGALASDAWMTLVCMATLSVYYAQLDERERQTLHEQREKSERGDAQKKKKQEEDKNAPVTHMDDADAERLDRQQKWPVCLEKSQNWLMQHDVHLVEHLQSVEDFVHKLLTEV